MTYIVGDCAPKVLICGPEFADLLAEIRRELDLPMIVSIEDALIDGALPYEVGVAASSDAEPVRPPLTGEDICCILYTSGTTGRPSEN